jgi:hypothetical protein
MTDARSKEIAEKTLLSVREEALRVSGDNVVAHLLTEELLRQVFEEAWRAQFDDDHASCQRAIRQLVDDAFDASELEGEPR